MGETQVQTQQGQTSAPESNESRQLRGMTESARKFRTRADKFEGYLRAILKSQKRHTPGSHMAEVPVDLLDAVDLH